jgi:xylulokinase
VRSVRQADRVLSPDTRAFIYQHTANVPTAKDVLPKILWLKEERPDLWERTRWLFDCKEYILFKLTGVVGIDWHGASVFFLFNPHTKTWDQEVCARLGIPVEKLPPTFPSTKVIGEVTAEAAAQTGLAAGTPVVICAGDVAVAQSGSGANREGRAHLCIGTATWVGVSSATLRNDPDTPFWALNHIDPGKYVIAGEMETGGGALQWYRNLLGGEEARSATERGVSTYQVLDELADAVPAGSDGLVFTPWLSGERVPVLDHYARGGFTGLSLGHTKGHLTRAVMEGVAYHIRWIIETMEHVGFEIGAMQAIGGGSVSPLWTQIIADVTGRRLNVVEHPLEAGAMGAALAVAVGLGVYPDMDAVDDLIAVARTVEPRRENEAVYERGYRTFRDLYTALAPIYRSGAQEG